MNKYATTQALGMVVVLGFLMACGYLAIFIISLLVFGIGFLIALSRGNNGQGQ